MRLHPTGKFDNGARTYRHIEARPLAAAMGAEIIGVEIAEVSDAQFAEVQHALFRHKMIYFRHQRALTHGAHESFSLRFGPFAEDAYTHGVPGHQDVHPLRVMLGRRVQNGLVRTAPPPCRCHAGP